MWDFAGSKACLYSFWVATLPTKEANFPLGKKEVEAKCKEDPGVLTSELRCDPNHHLKGPRASRPPWLAGKRLPPHQNYFITTKQHSLSTNYSLCFPLWFGRQN